MRQTRNEQTTQLRKQQKQSVWCLLYLMLPTHPALSIALFCTILATQSQLQTENITWKILQVGSLFSIRAIFKSVIKSSYHPASSCSGQEPSSWPLCLPAITVSLWVLPWLQCEMSPHMLVCLNALSLAEGVYHKVRWPLPGPTLLEEVTGWALRFYSLLCSSWLWQCKQLPQASAAMPSPSWQLEGHQHRNTC